MEGKKKPVTEMTEEELAAETAEFDAENVADSFGQPPPSALARWEQAKRKRGRPKRDHAKERT